jgi:ureidoacrylate peracid hydrolase
MAMPPELVAQATYRRDGLAVHGPPDLSRTALLAINLQNAWLAPDAPFRAFHADEGPSLMAGIPAVAQRVRAAGGVVVWLRTTTGAPGTAGYWAGYFDPFVGPDKRPAAIAALTAGGFGHALSPAFVPAPGDAVIDKPRFDAFLRTDLEAMLRDRGVRDVVVTGLATNVCCESTARSAMMQDFRTYMPHDLVAAPTPDGHAAGLRTVMQAFADVRPLGDLG